MAEALGAHSCATVTNSHVGKRVSVSTSTFYKHFGNLWDCLLVSRLAAIRRSRDREDELQPPGLDERLPELPPSRGRSSTAPAARLPS